ncbi:2051_t:CDS:1, partial [Acaulospora morrowiae]
RSYLHQQSEVYILAFWSGPVLVPYVMLFDVDTLKIMNNILSKKYFRRSKF